MKISQVVLIFNVPQDTLRYYKNQFVRSSMEGEMG